MTYSSSLAMNRQRIAGRHKNVVSFRTREHALGPISNTVILVVLSCLLGLLYLTQVVKTNSYGDKVYALQQQEQQLKNQNQNLQVDSAQLQSLDARVQNSAPAKNLVATAPSTTLTN